jgi:hypothetical protein
VTTSVRTSAAPNTIGLRRANSGARASGANFAAAPSATEMPVNAALRRANASSAATQKSATIVSFAFVSRANAV